MILLLCFKEKTGISNYLNLNWTNNSELSLFYLVKFWLKKIHDCPDGSVGKITYYARQVTWVQPPKSRHRGEHLKSQCWRSGVEMNISNPSAWQRSGMEVNICNLSVGGEGPTQEDSRTLLAGQSCWNWRTSSSKRDLSQKLKMDVSWEGHLRCWLLAFKYTHAYRNAVEHTQVHTEEIGKRKKQTALIHV